MLSNYAIMQERVIKCKNVLSNAIKRVYQCKNRVIQRENLLSNARNVLYIDNATNVTFDKNNLSRKVIIAEKI